MTSADGAVQLGIGGGLGGLTSGNFSAPYGGGLPQTMGTMGPDHLLGGSGSSLNSTAIGVPSQQQQFGGGGQGGYVGSQGSGGGAAGGTYAQSPGSKFGAGGSVQSPSAFSAGNSSPYAGLGGGGGSGVVSNSVPSAPPVESS